MLSDIYHLIGVEVESYYSIVALRFFRFLFNRETIALLVKFRYTITLRI